MTRYCALSNFVFSVLCFVNLAVLRTVLRATVQLHKACNSCQIHNIQQVSMSCFFCVCKNR